MPSPGWYPDPQDAASFRWFDGDAWTDYRQPVDSGTGGGASSASAASAPANSYDPYAALSESAYAGGGVATDATQTFAPVPELTDGQFGANGLTSDAVAGAGPANVPPRANHLADRRSGIDKRVLVIIGLVVVIVAALITGGILLFGGSDPSFTYQGKSIADASKTLTQAEDNLSTVIGQRHGAKNSSTRCYYALPTAPVNGKKTDIDSQIRCGPVLFVDGDPNKTYLSFGYTAAVSSGSVTLTPQTAPASNTPDGLPSGLTLKRPDGKTPGTGGLDAPNPPAADANVLTTGAIPTSSSTKTTTAVIGSLTGGITITDYGKVSRFGSGDSARSAPPNQVLYAFKLAAAAGNSGDVKDLSSATVISVDGGANKPLPSPAPAAGQVYVIAVPETTKSISLILIDSGITQTFSLIDGKLGTSNVVVLARAHRSVTVNQTVSATLNYSTNVVFSDKVTGKTQTASITLAGATLAYRDDVNQVTASAPDKAFLIPDIVYTGSHDGGPFGIDTALLTFTPDGGAAIPAKNISTDASKIRNVFEVPAGVTTGTLTVGGTATESFSGGTGTYTVSVAAPVGIPVAFPAN